MHHKKSKLTFLFTVDYSWLITKLIRHIVVFLLNPVLKKTKNTKQRLEILISSYAIKYLEIILLAKGLILCIFITMLQFMSLGKYTKNGNISKLYLWVLFSARYYAITIVNRRGGDVLPTLIPSEV